jgi:hypothetical protein
MCIKSRQPPTSPAGHFRTRPEKRPAVEAVEAVEVDDSDEEEVSDSAGWFGRWFHRDKNWII